MENSGSIALQKLLYSHLRLSVSISRDKAIDDAAIALMNKISEPDAPAPLPTCCICDMTIRDEALPEFTKEELKLFHESVFNEEFMKKNLLSLVGKEWEIICQICSVTVMQLIGIKKLMDKMGDKFCNIVQCIRSVITLKIGKIASAEVPPSEDDQVHEENASKEENVEEANESAEVEDVKPNFANDEFSENETLEEFKIPSIISVHPATLPSEIGNLDNESATSLRCNQCGHVFNHISKLRSHENSLNFQLGWCDMNFKSRNTSTKTPQPLNIKKNLTGVKRQLKLSQRAEVVKPQMAQKAKSKSDTVALFRTPFYCSKCRKYFTRKDSLDCHISLIHNDGKHRFECKTCKQKFYYLNKYQEHFRNKHKPQSTKKIGVVKRRGKRTACVCEVCGRYLSNKLRLRQHIQKIHDKIPAPLKCKTCPNTFFSNSDLQRHEKRHKKTNAKMH